MLKYNRPDDEPNCSRLFNFELENQKLDKKKLQQLMYEDALAFHPRSTKARSSLKK